MVQFLEGLAQFKQACADAEANGLKVIIDFTAAWCGPCKMIGPFFETLAETYAGKIVFYKVDVDEAEDISQFAGISAMPTFQVYKNGAKEDEMVGASRDKLEELIQKHVKAWSELAPAAAARGPGLPAAVPVCAAARFSPQEVCALLLRAEPACGA
eukprot:CAMPEP_0183794230 /NCGR_PEP_ID=MMETSP0803_2-20130417/3717_1 /TAXON_ID=195967 /ORGANISM="Crustomastix stigmata, Strain CCMP3273" /LENGTH=155 /DNA_ID=CAMNT_0026038629 /DNA_START=42 /DNA_END=507 /DNA_ORIENTATION=-